MRRGSRPETRLPRWPPVPEWAVAASAAAATAGGRPGYPAGREKKIHVAWNRTQNRTNVG